ncbi:hypothetical protein [Clostridium sp. USBA 49]|uniref:hypothetical protein n=1 Tax=Clostridium sp. USBA 49 TaxID=1881060 RepID=UPI0015D72873|nr:hypothetical protein [Clostridium sp. USBA 49]
MKQIKIIGQNFNNKLSYIIKLLVINRKNKTSDVKLVVGSPTTTKDTKEVYPIWIIVV